MLTEHQLMIQAKTLKANIESNAEKISFADACKVTLLARILEVYEDNKAVDPLRLYRGLRAVLPWWRRIFFRFNF